MKSRKLTSPLKDYLDIDKRVRVCKFSVSPSLPFSSLTPGITSALFFLFLFQAILLLLPYTCCIFVHEPFPWSLDPFQLDEEQHYHMQTKQSKTVSTTIVAEISVCLLFARRKHKKPTRIQQKFSKPLYSKNTFFPTTTTKSSPKVKEAGIQRYG